LRWIFPTLLCSGLFKHISRISGRDYREQSTLLCDIGAFIDNSNTSKDVFDLLLLQLNVARLSLDIINPATLSN
jgi:hypothetical protein